MVQLCGSTFPWDRFGSNSFKPTATTVVPPGGSCPSALGVLSPGTRVGLCSAKSTATAVVPPGGSWSCSVSVLSTGANACPRSCKSTVGTVVPPGGSWSSSLGPPSPGIGRVWVGHRRSSMRHVVDSVRCTTVCGMLTCGTADAPTKFATFQDIPDAWSVCSSCRNGKSVRLYDSNAGVSELKARAVR